MCLEQSLQCVTRNNIKFNQLVAEIMVGFNRKIESETDYSLALDCDRDMWY